MESDTNTQIKLQTLKLILAVFLRCLLLLLLLLVLVLLVVVLNCSARSEIRL